MQKISSKLPHLLILIIFLYSFIPFLAPITFKYGFDNIGISINEFYERFCHQRVERSLFLLGKESFANFYSVDELKAYGAIPESNPFSSVYTWPEYFGHDYVGNDTVGWKVPLCIRDLALYGGFTIVTLLLYWRKKIGLEKLEVPTYILALLLLPMIADGIFQTIVEAAQLTWIPGWYIHSIGKRILTGVLFGGAFGLIAFNVLFQEDILTKGSRNKRM